MRSLATIHVYTMGSMSYTREVIGVIEMATEIGTPWLPLTTIDCIIHQVLGVIDPHHSFRGKTLCRQDGDESLFAKELAHLFEDDERRLACSLVLDDREDAWDVVSRPSVLRCTPFRCWADDGSPLPPPPMADATLLDLLQV